MVKNAPLRAVKPRDEKKKKIEFVSSANWTTKNRPIGYVYAIDIRIRIVHWTTCPNMITSVYALYFTLKMQSLEAGLI